MMEADERNWTPPSPERRLELVEQYVAEGHYCMMEHHYTTPETVAEAKAHDWPAVHTELAPADEHRPFCSCGAAGGTVSGWREGREWIRRHREQHGLGWQVFVPGGMEVAPHLRDHEVFIDLDHTARDQGLGGWVALCQCEALDNEDDPYHATYEDAYETAVNHAAEHGGHWAEGDPKSKEELERID